METDQNKSICTPRRVQKCLLSSFESTLRKKKPILQDANYGKENETLSEEESDLGPMSPLAFTDRSPSISDSSSGREYLSPFATPEKSAHNRSIPWDRLTSRYNSEIRLSPFSSLKKVARSARYSPRCTIFNENSSKSLPCTPEKLAEPLTPQRSRVVDTMMEDVVPETPQRSCAIKMQFQNLTETPEKSKSPECRLLTPMSSLAKTNSLPRLHRKSLSSLETSENISPVQKGNPLKRKTFDEFTIKPTKLFKVDDVSAPRARAALFQEEENESGKLKHFSLSTKSFYSNQSKTERPFIFGSFKNNDVQKRRSLPIQNSRRSLKKNRFGRINAGVFHGIKKPKSKIHLVTKKEENAPASPNKSLPLPEEKVISPKAQNKRFFKTNKTVRSSNPATVTVNNKIKLKVEDGKIILNQKHGSSTTNAQKQQSKVSSVTMDATDLTVDEPEIETTLQQDKVADLLKILEDDWEDDYDTMQTLVNSTNDISTPKPVSTLLNDSIISPTSELSNITSMMNIEDVGLINDKNSNQNAGNDKEKSETRYFPLFTKGYSVPKNIFE